MLEWIAVAVMHSPVQRPLLWEWRNKRAGSVLSVVRHPSQGYMFVALNEGGVAVLRTPPEVGRVSEVAHIDKKRLANLDPTHLLIDGNRLYVALGNFFNPRGSKAGLASIDVSDPGKPVVEGIWTSPEKGRGASGLAIRGTTLAMGLMSKGVALFDVRDPSTPRLLSTYLPDLNYPKKNPREPSVPNARGLAFASDRLCVAFDAGGLRVLDCRAPAMPVEIGRYVQPKMLKKQQAYNNVVIDGNLAYLAVDYAGVEILDVSNPAEMKEVAWWNPWRADQGTNMWFNSPGHTNQLALDRETKRLYVSAGASDLAVLDVSDPGRPRQRGSYGSPRDSLGTWGLELVGDRLYLAYIGTLVPFKGTWPGVKCLAVSALR